MSIRNYQTNDLFKSAEPEHLNACVGENGGPYDFAAYSLGYFNAAAVLSEAAIDGQTNIDLAMYPITYSYRHGIELGLKHLLNVLPGIWNETAPPMRPTHGLIDVWQIVRPYLLRDVNFGNEEDGGSISFVSKVLQDIVQFDPAAEVFRFPSDRSGAFYLQNTVHVNLWVLNESLAEVHAIFETWFTIAYALKHGDRSLMR